jgi:hypothetical protein
MAQRSAAALQENSSEGGRIAIERFLSARNIRATVIPGPQKTYQIDYSVPSPAPRVSVLIPTTGGVPLLNSCLASILGATTYESRPSWRWLLGEER